MDNCKSLQPLELDRHTELEKSRLPIEPRADGNRTRLRIRFRQVSYRVLLFPLGNGLRRVIKIDRLGSRFIGASRRHCLRVVHPPKRLTWPSTVSSRNSFDDRRNHRASSELRDLAEPFYSPRLFQQRSEAHSMGTSRNFITVCSASYRPFWTRAG